ncbi:NUDIX domain-containing protein [Myceligenerans pegani]|uniref:NUDIX hydrolase n=1 Tax=Myceligenerans pegani TaxID=2776917 RepID=A0ABR9MVT7_9MICO|nr:NUDIX hydrolase [Myceligenerans sp. TRM 65318]MBE1875507.1 NUDIX hydrolase [Myceligenerans sp. TRM 65318]MBE3017778.1 NUDIX hydrolase [Myceligenerans sp. TRM 65318]
MTDLVRWLPPNEYHAKLPRKRIGAGVLLRGSGDRIVAIVPSYKPGLEIPGGVVETGESPWDAAERELKEELGIVREGMPLLVVDHVPVADDGVPEGLLLIFDGGWLTPDEERDLRGTDEEVWSVSLYEIDEATREMKTWLGRRVRLAFETAKSVSGPALSAKGHRRPVQSQPPQPAAPDDIPVPALPETALAESR